MKIFLLKIKLETKENIKSNFYYSVLGSILNLFKNDEEVYKSILSISPLIKQEQNFLIKISIFWEKNFNRIVNEILFWKKELSLDWIVFRLLWIDFSFWIFDLEKIEYKNFENILLDFKSPSFVKIKKNNKDINCYLPKAKKFFISAIKKYLKLSWEEFNNFWVFIEKIENNFFISEFNIHTKKIKIKNWIKAWVVWTVKYKILQNNDFKKKELILINNSLKLANYIWIWNGTKLWLGQVMVKIF